MAFAATCAPRDIVSDKRDAMILLEEKENKVSYEEWNSQIINTLSYMPRTSCYPFFS